jgi:hypothetical protein
MKRLLRRLALTTALAAGSMAIFAAAPALAYNQPLNEHEAGIAAPDCETLLEGAVTGSPISNGEMEAELFLDCAPGDECYQMFGIVLMGDSQGDIEKLLSGKFCIVFEGPEGVRYSVKGSYQIVGGDGVYSGATGSGSVQWTIDCLTGPGVCFFSGSETSAQDEGIVQKTGGQPENVLLCSPTLVKRSDGSLGVAVQFPYADYAAWLADPTTHPEIPAGAVPAKYGQDIGLTCDNLPGYIATGTFVDAVGAMYGDGKTIVGGNFYPYWVKA